MNIPNARNLLRDIKQSAVKAGIYHAWFLAFGTLLGACRPSNRKGLACQHGIIEHDDDMDIGIFTDQITAEQEEAYLAYLREAGAFLKREADQRRTDNNRLVWFTLRREDPPDGTKCCHWLFYEWNGFMWHSKGKQWLDERKFPSHKYPHAQTDEAMGKGVKATSLLPTELVEIDFEGERYNVPAMAGHLMDAWYPCWMVPRIGGASATEYIMKVGKWANKQTWRIF